VSDDEKFEYLEPPWEVRNGVCVVKGSDCKFEADVHGGLVSKYVALFDSRAQFGNLRVSFLHSAGGQRLERLEQALLELISSDYAIDQDATQAVFQHLELCRGHFDAWKTLIDCPTGFADSAWPLLVDCMCDELHHFYLSVNELLLLCEICQQNVAIFGTSAGTAQFLGTVKGHARSTNVMVAVHVGGSQARVRSHFQRLVPLADLNRAESIVACHREETRTQHREQVDMALADRQTRQHISWLAPIARCMTKSERAKAARRVQNSRREFSDERFDFFPDNILFVLFQVPTTISLLRIYNYSKTPGRGVKTLAIHIINCNVL
jgi:hypothetical protein